MGVKKSRVATARNKRAVAPALNRPSFTCGSTRGDLSTATHLANAERVARSLQTRLSRQQKADACIEYWNEAFAVEGSFADEHAIL
jgi:hypothetical protein